MLVLKPLRKPLRGYLGLLRSLIGRLLVAVGWFRVPPVVVVSPGGAGTTAILTFLQEQGISCNRVGDQDGLKHLASPAMLPDDTRVIFLASNLGETLMSLGRRGILRRQTIKISGLKNLFVRYSTLVSNFEKAFLAQHANFAAREDTLLLHYDRLFESGNELADYLGANERFRQQFPRRKTRYSVGFEENH